MIKTLYLTCCFFLLSLATANAQFQLIAEDGSPGQLNTYAHLTTGMTVTNQVKLRIKYEGNLQNVNQWKLTVRLTQNYIANNGSGVSIGAQYTSLKFNGQETYNTGDPINLPTQAFQMTTANEVTLVQSNVGLIPNVHRLFYFNQIIQGGNHLLTAPNATYNSAYEFKLYRITGGTQHLIGTVTAPVGNSARFQIEYGPNNGQSVSLLNGANQFNLQFNNAADFASGKSVTVLNGIRVNTWQNYQLSVKASATDMTSATTSSTIPVSKLKVKVSKSPVPSGVTINNPVPLSTSNQTIASRNGNSGGNMVDYDLTFFIDPGALQSNIPAGTYTTYVYFSMVLN